MPESYFKNFPIISYSNTQVVDITQRVALLSTLYSNPTLFYPYDVRQGERPDNIAGRYYGDPYVSWLMYLTNQIIDPYYDWYMDQTTFNNFIVKKYGSILLAQSKIKNYQNNWYENQDPITVSAYQALDQSLVKFYQPNFGSNPYNTSPINYTRRQDNWELATNMIVNFSVYTSATLIDDEIVNVYSNNSLVANGQVCFANSTSISLQHIQGSNGTIANTGTCYLYGTQSSSVVLFTESTQIVNNIPLLEIPYWSSVSYFDYETTRNEYNKSILVLDNKYVPQAVQQLAQIV